MMRYLSLQVGCLALVTSLAGCGDGGHFQEIPGTENIALTINGKTLETELALFEGARKRGLKFRTAEDFPADRAMLFAFPNAGKRKFWMKNTQIPLSIAYIADNGEILQIEDMKPYDERDIWSKDKVRYALEVNQGWFRDNGIEVGATIDDFENQVARLMIR